MGPREALASGVLDELLPRDRVLPRALEVARDLASMPREAFVRTKRGLRGEGGPEEGWLAADVARAAAGALRR